MRYITKGEADDMQADIDQLADSIRANILQHAVHLHKMVDMALRGEFAPDQETYDLVKETGENTLKIIESLSHQVGNLMASEIEEVE